MNPITNATAACRGCLVVVTDSGLPVIGAAGSNRPLPLSIKAIDSGLIGSISRPSRRPSSGNVRWGRGDWPSRCGTDGTRGNLGLAHLRFLDAGDCLFRRYISSDDLNNPGKVLVHGLDIGNKERL